MEKLENQEKPQLKKWQKSMILIAHPDGHNFVKSQNLNGDNEGFFVSKKFDESDIHFRPGAKGKDFYQFYKSLPLFIILSTLVQVIKCEIKLPCFRGLI